MRSVEQISQLEPGKETLYSVQLGTDFATREWVKESELEAIKPTAEQQKQYTRLSGTLQAIGHRHYSELPNGATSLSLNVTDGRVVVEVYDNQGKKIGTAPNDRTSPAFRSALQQFLRETLPDPDGVVSKVRLICQVYYCPYKSLAKQTTLTLVRINTYEKHRGWEGYDG